MCGLIQAEVCISARLKAEQPCHGALKSELKAGFTKSIMLIMNLLERITIEPGKCGGRPCIRGYRIRVSDILDLIAAGASREEILADYDFLEPDDITAALTYAAHQTDHTVLAVAA